MNRSCQRRQRFIDRPIQGALIVRAVLFWGCTLISQCALMIAFAVLFTPPEEFYTQVNSLFWNLKLAAYGSLIVLPLILYDLIRLSHRWVGPIFRLRTAMQSLGRGEQVEPIRFREGDYWQELAGDFNVIAAELTRLRQSAAADTLPTKVELDAEDSKLTALTS